MRPGRRPADLDATGTVRLAPIAVGALSAAVLVHLAPAITSWRSLRCRVLPTLSGVGDDPHVALTFDDGPDPVSTPAFLDTLDELGWRATFFCLGQQVRRDPDLTREVVRRGHELGVHGDVHTSHLRRPVTWTVPDLLRARDLVAEVSGVEPAWFRPPYGAVAASSLAAAHRAGVQTVLWTSWGRDWRAEATAETVVADVERTWHPGATVLLHDSDITSAPNCWHSALGALPLLAERWAARGLSVGTLGEHGIGAPTWRLDEVRRARHRRECPKGSHRR
ncbi:MAG: polysaccharide deacetylase family protein [Actinomycetota bacterium]|nr:polysaccharide deacetylase family protein [Actinomycetota bacterium]MDQ6945367.1 polysaccharide deacetylase family protein [Actinomycetota bacterium]